MTSSALSEITAVGRKKVKEWLQFPGRSLSLSWLRREEGRLLGWMASSVVPWGVPELVSGGPVLHPAGQVTGNTWVGPRSFQRRNFESGSTGQEAESFEEVFPECPLKGLGFPRDTRPCAWSPSRQRARPSSVCISHTCLQTYYLLGRWTCRRAFALGMLRPKLRDLQA